VTVHALVEITCPPETGCMALCSCGWQSAFYSSAGMAGSVWDAHVDAEANESQDRNPTGTPGARPAS
jgi:hypothetical protein